MTDTMTPYAVEAFNVAADSENKLPLQRAD